MKRINIILSLFAISILAFSFIQDAKKGKKATEKKANKSTSTQNAPTNAVAEGINIGNKAPELKFLTPEGKELALSSLRGQMVLIDFWASWCGPCRMENPNVVSVYNKYKDKKFKGAKGFTIYSVSLDNNKDRWVAAIAQDHLEWPNHVSDLGSWQSKAAKIYQIYSIPTNFLIDSEGIIIAKNLRGPELEAEISKHTVVQ